MDKNTGKLRAFTIGIDASRAFLRRRTGIEEYSYQTIKHLRKQIPTEAVKLYVRKRLSFQGGRVCFILPEIDFELPEAWQVKGLWAPRFWTQVRLSLEMFFSPPDVLFVPAHTVPLVHPKRTIVTIHGLEYELSPESYGFWERCYMRLSIRYSVWVAEKVIAVSENTKRDLMRFYAVPEKNISVVYEGISSENLASGIRHQTLDQKSSIPGSQFFLFIGRIETRKNVIRMIEAFEMFKENTGLPHELLLVGKPGHGYGGIEERISESEWRDVIREIGYVSEEEKWQLLRGAEVLLFPSLYEGFGLPVLEAQRAGVAVIAANTSSLPEIAGKGAILVDPFSPVALAEAMERIIRNPEIRTDIIRTAFQNSQRFSWERCAEGIADVIFPQS